MRKIEFEVVVADDFVYPEEVRGLWPVPYGKYEKIFPVVEFEPSGGNIMHDAEEALGKYMKENYPNKEYKIYYWNWKN